jgi:hypothetical protein
MSVVFQIAGKFKPATGPRLVPACEALKQAAAGCPGHLRSMLLTNQATLQFQLLFYWGSYEQGLAFYQEVYPRASAGMASLVEARGTLITSQLEIELSATAGHEVTS